MNKESKGFTITVVSIVLLIFFFTLAIGIVIGVFAVSEPDAGNLKFWSSLGDALNPLIGFISAVLVAAGLVYTARDFRLAREEFTASRIEMEKSNVLSSKAVMDRERERKINLYKQGILQYIEEITSFQFSVGVNILILSGDGVTQPEVYRYDCCKVKNIKDLSTLYCSNGASEFKETEFINILGSGSENIYRNHYYYDDPYFSIVINEIEIIEFFPLVILLRKYKEVYNDFLKLVGSEELNIYIRPYINSLKRVHDVLEIPVLTLNDVKSKVGSGVIYEDKVYNLATLRSKLGLDNKSE